MACYLHSTYNVATVKKLRGEMEIFCRLFAGCVGLGEGSRAADGWHDKVGLAVTDCLSEPASTPSVRN